MQQNRNHIPPSYYYSAPPTTASRRPVRPASGRRVLVASVLIPLFVVGGLFMFVRSALSHDSLPATANNTPSPTPKPAPKPKAPTISLEEMKTNVQSIITANPDVEISVTAINLDSGEQTQLGLKPTTVYEAASVAKLITAADYYTQVEQGKAKLGSIMENGKSAQASLETMIVDSDNTAWKALNDELTHASLLEYSRSIGFTEYDPDLNRVTPTEIAILLQKLYGGKLLDADHTKQLLGYMARANRTDFIKAGLPSSATVYHKAGWVEDRAHDAAIITGQNAAYALVIFTNGHGKAHVTDRSVLLQNITKATYAHYIDKTPY